MRLTNEAGLFLLIGDDAADEVGMSLVQHLNIPINGQLIIKFGPHIHQIVQRLPVDHGDGLKGGGLPLLFARLPSL